MIFFFPIKIQNCEKTLSDPDLMNFHSHVGSLKSSWFLQHPGSPLPERTVLLAACVSVCKCDLEELDSASTIIELFYLLTFSVLEDFHAMINRD